MITVGICGYDSMHKIKCDRLFPDGYGEYTLLLVKTEAFFEIDGSVINTPPNTVIIYNPHKFVHYGCQKPHYNDDWIHFQLHEDDSDILEKLNIPVDHPFTLPYMGTLTEYCRLLVQEKLSDHSHKLEVLDSLMHTLLYSIADLLHSRSDENINHKYYHLLNIQRLELLNAPYKKWSIPEIALKLHLSVSHFQHLYKQFFKTSCQKDIIEARINYAKLYLCTSEMSVSSLALFCGYDNELHFMRQFKKITGMTPSQYRESHRYQQGERVSLS